jgi:transcription antitermination factor NusG
VIAPIRFEPQDGMDNISEDDISTTYRGDIIITRTPLSEQKIRIARSQQIAGIIAPSMDASLESRALNTEIPIMLVTGFGESRIIRSTMNILENYEGYQGVLDAAYPHRFDDRRAELMINQHTKEDVPTGRSLPLREGMTVRITRAPYAGRTGEVVEIPTHRILLANGLRVMGAYIEIGVDEIVAVPLANLELAGT